MCLNKTVILNQIYVKLINFVIHFTNIEIEIDTLRVFIIVLFPKPQQYNNKLY